MRGAFLGMLLSLLPLTGAVARAATPVDVVKFASFDCPVCRASEMIDLPIREQVQREGGMFDFAPLPRGNEDARERFYYAMRGLSPQIESQVRSLLFSGSQDYGYPLSNVAETLDWLKSNMLSQNIDWSAVVQKVTGGPAESAVNRAVALAIRSGVTVVPTYVLVRGDQVLATLDPDTSGGQLPQLRDAVLAALGKAEASH